MMPSSPNARGRRTVAAIEQAALDAACEAAVDHITVRDVCARAGVSERVFFNHFATREDAFLGRDLPVLDHDWADRYQSDPDIPLLLGAARLVITPAVRPELLERRLALIGSDRDLLARAHARLLPLRDECRAIVAAAVARRRPSLDPDQVEQMAAVVVAAAAELLGREDDVRTAQALLAIRDDLIR